MTHHYKKSLVLAATELDEAENKLKDALVNVAFAGVYKDITEVCEEGDEIQMHAAYFEDTGDPNIDLLYKVVEQLVRAKHSLMSANAIEINRDG